MCSHKHFQKRYSTFCIFVARRDCHVIDAIVIDVIGNSILILASSAHKRRSLDKEESMGAKSSMCICILVCPQREEIFDQQSYFSSTLVVLEEK